MNPYVMDILAAQHRADLLEEAERERLARQVRQRRRVSRGIVVTLAVLRRAFRSTRRSIAGTGRAGAGPDTAAGARTGASPTVASRTVPARAVASRTAPAAE